MVHYSRIKNTELTIIWWNRHWESPGKGVSVTAPRENSGTREEENHFTLPTLLLPKGCAVSEAPGETPVIHEIWLLCGHPNRAHLRCPSVDSSASLLTNLQSPAAISPCRVFGCGKQRKVLGTEVAMTVLTVLTASSEMQAPAQSYRITRA